MMQYVSQLLGITCQSSFPMALRSDGISDAPVINSGIYTGKGRFMAWFICSTSCF